MFLEIQVIVSVTLKDPLGPLMCMAEQLVTNLQVLQRPRLQEKGASVKKHKCLRF